MTLLEKMQQEVSSMYHGSIINVSWKYHHIMVVQIKGV